MKKKIICASVIILICAGLFTVCMLKNPVQVENSIILENSYSREAYLNIKGWEVEEISCEPIRVPENFEGIYEEYAEVQSKQELPLENYKGKEVQRYLYKVINFNTDSDVCAELLISENKLIAAALIENKPDGFISAVSMNNI